MSFSLYLSNVSSEQLAFGYSAAHETLIALHVFDDCKHHPLHIPWVIQARRKIPTALKREMAAFRFLYQRPLVTFWNLQSTSLINPFEADLESLLEANIDFFVQTIAEAFIGPCETSILKDPNRQKDLVDVLTARNPECHAEILNVIHSPLEARQRFVNMMEAFWNACVKEEWPRIETLLLKDISFRGTKLMNEGVLPLLASLSKEIDIYPNENRAVIRRISKKEIFLDETDDLFLAPTYFAWPHLFVNSTKPIGINYSIMENQQAATHSVPPEDLVSLFRAMGDFTRLQIIKFLAHKPRSTRELAGLIGVTEGAISKHLRQLAEAGLVTSKRESYYVFYHLQTKAIDTFPLGLKQFIGT